MLHFYRNAITGSGAVVGRVRGKKSSLNNIDKYQQLVYNTLKSIFRVKKCRAWTRKELKKTWM
jgi:hypothetical protein